MKALRKTLEIGSSPHVGSGASVEQIMRNVVLAMLPVCAFAIYTFGLGAALVILTATLSCVAAEYLVCKATRQANTLSDWSAIITGMLYALTLPPSLPLWMVAVGGFFGIGVTKGLFGGLGSNAFNPALVGRAFLQATFPQAMTQWAPAFSEDRFEQIAGSLLTIPFTRPVYDAVTAATPLSALKFQGNVTASPDLMLGLTSGSTGETCALLIALGGVYLIARNMMSWRIPLAILVTVGLITLLFHTLAPSDYPSPLFMLFSGGLMLGAVFMATDPVASPMTHRGAVVYGVLIGLLVVVIRFWGGMPEGVMYAILLANAVSPHIDRLLQPTPFGTRGAQ